MKAIKRNASVTFVVWRGDNQEEIEAFVDAPGKVILLGFKFVVNVTPATSLKVDLNEYIVKKEKKQFSILTPFDFNKEYELPEEK